MSTKRKFYKNVDEQNAIKKRTRRPLAQGRLVVAQQGHLSSSGARLPQGRAQDVKVSHVPLPGREELNVTPRRAVPQVTEHQSPRHSPPVRNLDLSDTEADDSYPSQQKTPEQGLQTSVRQVQHCLVLDASALGPSPDIKIGYERSPALVVSHGKRTTGSNSPGTAGRQGFTHWRVDVDQVPKMAVTDMDQPSSPEPLDVLFQKMRTESSLVRVSQLPDLQFAGSSVSGLQSTKSASQQQTQLSHQPGKRSPTSLSPADPLCRADSRTAQSRSTDKLNTLVSLASRQEKADGQHSVKVPQPNFDVSDESERDEPGGTSRGQQRLPEVPADATSDSDACSLFEYVPQAKNRSKTTGSAKKVAPKSEKKKKGERIVPSRFMQSASAKSRKVPGQEAGDKTLQAKRSLILQNSSHGNRAQGLDATVKSHSRSDLQNRGATPDVQSRRKGKTSTPTHDEAPHMVSCDASAINVDNPELSVLSFDVSHLKQSSGHLSCQSPRKQKKLDPKVQQQRLDLHYSRYLQWLFLDSRARQALLQQEKEAMKQLSQMWEYVEKQRESARDLEKNMARMRHLNLLDGQLHVQHTALEPLVQALPRAKKDYCQFAAALDTTRHQLQTKGVHLPEDQDHFLACLEEVLQESELLLGELSTATKNDSQVVSEFAGALQSIEKAVDTECQELNRCTELLSALRTLTTQENSLRIQAMQKS